MHQPNREITSPLRVLWTRGHGCAELADALSGGTAVRATGAIEQVATEHRADLLVARKMPTTPVVSTAMPIDFQPEEVGSVVALIGGGPHSVLVARLAARLGLALQVSVELVSGYRLEEERAEAEEHIEEAHQAVGELPGRVVEARSARDLVDAMPPDSLMMLGAPGGSWMQRMFLGPGARMTSNAPAGAVVVHSVPRKAFHVMVEPEYVSPLLGAEDALWVGTEPVLAVVDARRLIGLVRRGDLVMAGSGVSVGAVMRDPVSVEATAGFHEIGDAAAKLGATSIPVVDDDGQLIGMVRPDALR